jgi:hypothetical protein
MTKCKFLCGSRGALAAPGAGSARTPIKAELTPENNHTFVVSRLEGSRLTLVHDVVAQRAVVLEHCAEDSCGIRRLHSAAPAGSVQNQRGKSASKPKGRHGTAK